ncbi:hypothetical protein BKG82_27240 [Mycobacteroides chelonae]|uniref:HTH cro/C1-type domain-containing protein n=1 Tax=Mycobacteroides chelonae TaxID=1774 RepID=A0A1S1LD52_MYCCH|nr:helix-turn-helix transcriptional regulator [Mycobacteroides chelonae]OHU47348.1 hypothetical protein BKG82_27240 [Mycobacteroides chelonae]
MRTLAMAVSDTLRGIAAKRRVDQVELAQRTGYHRSTINRLLNGRTVMGLDDAYILSHSLDVSLQDVIAEALTEMPDKPRLSTPDERLRSI